MNKHQHFPTAGHYIQSEFVCDSSLGLDDVLDPATGKVIGHACLGNKSIADQAVAVARNAFFTSNWGENPRLRAQVLLEFAAIMERRQKDLVDLLVLENGKLVAEAEGEVRASISEARYYAGLARNIFGRMTEIDPGKLSLLAREPGGVVTIIVPWNAPVTLLVRSLAPALAAGCTTVIKPSPLTPLINQVVMQCIDEISDLPPGVVNSVNENGIEVGQALVASPDVDIISFTGSSRTGKTIMAAAAPTLKRLSLELGGKTPSLLFQDADMSKAVAELTRGALVMAGQMCVAASRILVHETRFEEAKETFVAAFSQVKVGPGNAPSSGMGPMIDFKSRDRVETLISRADDEGEVLLRGESPGGSLADGAFLTPTLFTIQDLESELVQEEIFGPMVSLEVFSDEPEAIARANATRYGLAASVFTNDLNRAHRVSRALRFGTVWLNSHSRLFAEIETGGYGESGLGRLHGVEGLEDFLETKHVYLEPGQSGQV